MSLVCKPLNPAQVTSARPDVCSLCMMHDRATLRRVPSQHPTNKLRCSSAQASKTAARVDQDLSRTQEPRSRCCLGANAHYRESESRVPPIDFTVLQHIQTCGTLRLTVLLELSPDITHAYLITSEELVLACDAMSSGNLPLRRHVGLRSPYHLARRLHLGSPTAWE